MEENHENIIFFELLQVAIGNRQSLSVIPSRKEWSHLFEIAKKQALAGISFTALNKIFPASPIDEGKAEGIDKELFFEWLGIASIIVQRNNKLNDECIKVCAELKHNGFRCCILKGQGNHEYYPEHLEGYRTPGDIDIWCIPKDQISIAVGDNERVEYANYSGNRAIVEYILLQSRIQKLNGEKGWYELGYHHTSYFLLSGTELELHYRPTWLSSPLRNIAMQRWFKKQMDIQLDGREYKGFSVPTVGFNVVYQMTHIFNHMFEEGIGLRQLLDYYMVLRMYHNDLGELADHKSSMGMWVENMSISLPSHAEITHTLSTFGLRKFAGAVMWVLQKVFAMPNCYMICPANEKEGRFLLREIMASGNFGISDNRIKYLHTKSGVNRKIAQLKHTFRLLKHYPEETICSPFRIYHVIWRKLSLWKYE